MSLLSVPLKAIIPWLATSANQVLPAGFEYCDGRTITDHDMGGGPYVLPDLRNRIPLGADRTRTSTPTAVGDAVANAPSINEVGGMNGITLAIGNMPVHNHSGSSDSQGYHTHTANSDGWANHNHGFTDWWWSAGGTISVVEASDFTQITCTSASTTSAGSHSHSFTPNADTGHSGAHTITISSARNASQYAGGSPYDNRPRVHGVVYIMRVKNSAPAPV